MFRLYIGLHWPFERSYTTKQHGYKENLWILPDMTFVSMHILSFVNNLPNAAPEYKFLQFSTISVDCKRCCRPLKIMMPNWERCMRELCHPMHLLDFTGTGR